MENPNDPVELDAYVSPETPLEAQILADPEWVAGAAWGKPRPGHPEGLVASHIAEVLSNIEREAVDADDRERLRLVALVHDTFKHRVDRARPRTGENHHAMIARRFAERYIDDQVILEVIELHDEAYNAWVKGERGGKWEAAEARAERLIERLGSSLAFYVRFYRADNDTGTKESAPLEWFEKTASRRRSSQLSGAEPDPHS